MSELLAKDGNMTLKESVQHMGNKFLNGVETAEQNVAGIYWNFQ